MEVKGKQTMFFGDAMLACLQSIEEPYDIYKGDLFKLDIFIKEVYDSNINNYDGHIGCIIVDGYETNLGIVVLRDNDVIFADGKLLVEAEYLLDMFFEEDIVVNWINK